MFCLIKNSNILTNFVLNRLSMKSQEIKYHAKELKGIYCFNIVSINILIHK